MLAFVSDPRDASVRPDLQMILSRPLGNGSLEVCDNTSPTIGGVPAAPDYSVTQPISNAISDLGCRFLNGNGAPLGRDRNEACTKGTDGEFRLMGLNSTIQFCGAIGRPFSFPPGDTLVTVRLRDTGGNLSLPAQIIVRVLSQ
jgi:hypothetical protein